MAKAFDFIQATNEVLSERGVKLPLPSQSTTTPQDRLEKVIDRLTSAASSRGSGVTERSEKRNFSLQKD
jgi:4-carboxymuconolactone decarboxylase